MIRLYLDWNVINGMRNCKDGETLYLLRKFIEENSSYFEIYYSYAHLSDLAGHKKTLDADTRADLDYLTQITDNLAFNIAKGEIKYGNFTPLEWYKTIIEDSTLLEANSLEDLFKGITEDDPEFSDIISKQIELLKSIPIPKDMGKLEFLFPGMTGKSLYDATNAVLRMNKAWMNTDAYGKVRTILQKIMNSKANIISSSKDPFAAIDNSFKALGEASSYSHMEQVIKDSSEKYFKNCPAWYNEITSTYFNLDMHGYSSDNIKVTDKRKHTFHNTVNDASHAAFASMCHFYILADNKARRKAEATYKRLSINTIILSPDIKKDDLFKLFVQGEFIRNPPTAQELFNSVMMILTSSKLITEDANNGEQKILSVYPNCFFYGFFNKIIVVPAEKEFQIVLSTKEPTNWCGLTVDATVKLANRLLSLFGEADSGKKHVEPEDFNELRANPDLKWGLSWNSTIYLYVFSGRVQLYFPSIPSSKINDNEND